jgi:hypothetical protein
MRRKKEDIIVLIFASILTLIVLGIAFVALTSSRVPIQPKEKHFTPPTRVPTKPTPTLEPSSEETQTTPPVLYDQKASDLLLERVENRLTLSNDDIIAKAKILAPINGESGYVYQTERIYIEYVKSADLFLVEIRTSNIDQAKAEAVLWFQTQGVSQEGICNYPVEFYLNYNVAEYLRGSNVVFNPLANACK